MFSRLIRHWNDIDRQKIEMYNRFLQQQSECPLTGFLFNYLSMHERSETQAAYKWVVFTGGTKNKDYFRRSIEIEQGVEDNGRELYLKIIEGYYREAFLA